MSAAVAVFSTPAIAGDDAHAKKMHEKVKEHAKEIMDSVPEKKKHGGDVEKAHADAKAQVQKSMAGKKQAHSGVDWGYTGSGAAHNWGDLDKQYKSCKKGMKQSPVNISKFMQKEMEPLKAAYGQSPLMVVNNGHTVQVNYKEGSKLISGEKMYHLKQFHFHTPSEHYIDGTPYPMEVHFVHQADDGELAVVGVMMKIGKKNETIGQIWSHIPKSGETNMPKDLKVSAADLLPRTGIYYKYDGSLTTPPCTEGVKWHVMQDPIEISQEQLTAFQALFPVNARPVQPLKGRVITGG